MLLRRSIISRAVGAVIGGTTEYTTAGTYTYTVPAGVYEISGLCVGGGGGGTTAVGGNVSGGAGGELSYSVSIPVVPGESLDVVVGAGGASGTNGGASSIQRSGTTLLSANGGAKGAAGSSVGGTGGVGLGGDGGGSTPAGVKDPAGGGGAGGYSGNGGAGGRSTSSAGSGGAGGGGYANGEGGGGGGGVGIRGSGSNGAAGTSGSNGGGGGSGGAAGVVSSASDGGNGGAYGGGGGSSDGPGSNPGVGGSGAVSIRWGTNNRFPIPLACVKGVASAGATSVTLPTHVTGDLIIVFAYRDGNTTQPTLPAGFTAISNAVGANSCSGTLGYKVAASGSETSGTWTNANAIMAVVIAGQNASPIGGSGVGGGASVTVTYPTLTMSDASGNSVVLAFSGHRSVNTALEIPPINMLLVGSFVNATCEIVCHVTEGGVTSFASRAVKVNGTSSGWRAHSVEIKK